MTKQTPQPRSGFYYGRTITNVKGTYGTWLEGEEFAYPNGGMTRRCYARCEDGVMRVAWVGIPDTYFSIPGFIRVRGHRIKGFVSSNNVGEFTFKEYHHG